MQKLIIAGLVGTAAFSGAGTFARNRDTNEAAIIANAKVSVAQAITTAEQVTGGMAVKAGIEDEDGTVFLKVQILKGNQRQKVFVDPQSGQVVKVDRKPSPEEQARIEQVLRGEGFTRWDDIELDDNVWDVDDARTADGREFDLELDPNSFQIVRRSEDN
jgi:uncharacterized membrane protein YkoI